MTVYLFFSFFLFLNRLCVCFCLFFFLSCCYISSSEFSFFSFFFFRFLFFGLFLIFFFFLFLAAETPQTVKNNTRRGGERELDAQMGPWPDTKRRGHRKKATRTSGRAGGASRLSGVTGPTEGWVEGLGLPGAPACGFCWNLHKRIKSQSVELWMQNPVRSQGWGS